MIFLVADTQLYKRLCPSVGSSVHWSVGPLVHRSVTHKSKSGKMSVLDAFMGMCVGGGVYQYVTLSQLSDECFP